MKPTTEQRRERVANGSRRKRDLEAGREQEVTERQAREDRLRPKITEMAKAATAWEQAAAALAAAVSPAALRLWITPLHCIGEASGALCLEAPPAVVSWTERRYGRLIGETVRSVSEYRGVFFFLGSGTASDEDEDGLL